jgi:hypothetical protein
MTTSFINFKALSNRIAEVRAELAQLVHLESFAKGSSQKKRGRPAKIQNSAAKNGKPGSKRGRKPGKRAAIGDNILKFLSSRGKEGAHVKDIGAHVGAKSANVTAWIYSTGKAKVKKVKPATFAIKN